KNTDYAKDCEYGGKIFSVKSMHINHLGTVRIKLSIIKVSVQNTNHVNNHQYITEMSSLKPIHISDDGIGRINFSTKDVEKAYDEYVRGLEGTENANSVVFSVDNAPKNQHSKPLANCNDRPPTPHPSKKECELHKQNNVLNFFKNMNGGEFLHSTQSLLDQHSVQAPSPPQRKRKSQNTAPIFTTNNNLTNTGGNNMLTTQQNSASQQVKANSEQSNNLHAHSKELEHSCGSDESTLGISLPNSHNRTNTDDAELTPNSQTPQPVKPRRAANAGSIEESQPPSPEDAQRDISTVLSQPIKEIENTCDNSVNKTEMSDINNKKGTNPFGNDSDFEEEDEKEDTMSRRSSGIGTTTSVTTEPPIYAKVNKENNKYNTTYNTTSQTCKGGGDSIFSNLSTNSGVDSDAPLVPPRNKPAIVTKKSRSFFIPSEMHALKQKGFIIPVVSGSCILLCTSIFAGLAYSKDKEKLFAFITSNPKLLTITASVVLALFIISIYHAAKKSHYHEIKDKDNSKVLKSNSQILNEVCDYIQQDEVQDKLIKSMLLKYSNNTYSTFTFSVLESKRKFFNIDEKVISRTNKLESIINDRPLFTALLTAFITANIMLPSLLYATGGVNNVAMFYKMLPTTDLGISIIVGASLFALSILCLGVRYYNKTNCTNLIYPCTTTKIKDKHGEINVEIIGEICRQKVDVLGGSHKKEAKCASLKLEQIVVERHNADPTIYNVISCA
ncbi:hypothetical protein, partial [Wolbachia endosymbiont of Pentidionis agamae]|uniref:hypothetical protein n=1 Tax=Wolbachia endosymbiont of Pentidionis agamae TaxID=3110435 RepID=UPI002FD324A4